MLLQPASALRPLNKGFLVTQTHHRALAAIAKGDTADALVYLRKDAGGAQDWAALDAAAATAAALGDHQLALELSSRAVKAAPRETKALYNYATALWANGQLTAAAAEYGRILSITPDDHEAWLHRTQIVQATPSSNHIDALRVLASRAPSWRPEVSYRYALFKELDDLARHDEAFEELNRAARLKRRHTLYSIEQDVETMDAIARAFSKHWAMRPMPASAPAEAPIFIVGLPRSGTTLIERVLASHPDVAGLGELNTLTTEVMRAAKALSIAPKDRAGLVWAAANEIDHAALGRRYLEQVRPLAGQKLRFTDKLPLNFLYVGLIRRALPEARIILVSRGRLDTCFSMYRTLFRDAYPFSYDMAECGLYYQAYRKLMGHWLHVFGNKIHEVRYEDLVADFEPQVRHLLHYCGLEWDANCLAFERNPQPCATASAAQVRRPLYSEGIGSWQRYARHLEPLAMALGNS